MYSESKLIEFLRKDKYKNINMINFVDMYPIYSIDKVGQSVLVRGKSDENWVYISSSSIVELRELMNKLNDEDKYYAVIEDWMVPILTKCKEVEWKLSCIKYIFPDNKKLPKNKCKIVELSVEDAKYIYDNYEYKDYASIEYISERIKKDISLGIVEDDKLVGWIMTHDDGAIGLLNVLKVYRKKGYGYELVLAMLKEIIKQDRVPFVHIEGENIKSTNLAIKIGFEKDRVVHWFKLK